MHGWKRTGVLRVNLTTTQPTNARYKIHLNMEVNTFVVVVKHMTHVKKLTKIFIWLNYINGF